MEKFKNKFMELKKNDRIIWDSGFGYELGYYTGESVAYEDLSIKLITGKYKGTHSVSSSQVKPYSIELEEKMINQYGYSYNEFKISLNKFT